MLYLYKFDVSYSEKSYLQYEERKDTIYIENTRDRSSLDLALMFRHEWIRVSRVVSIDGKASAIDDKLNVLVG